MAVMSDATPNSPLTPKLCPGQGHATLKYGGANNYEVPQWFFLKSDKNGRQMTMFSCEGCRLKNRSNRDHYKKDPYFLAAGRHRMEIDKWLNWIRKSCAITATEQEKAYCK